MIEKVALATRWGVALFLIYLAVFLRKDERGRYHNKLEAWMEKLEHQREAAHTRATALMGGVAEITTRGFDRLFGAKLLSLRGVGVSVCLSLASFLLTVNILSISRYAGSSHPSLQLWVYMLGLVLLASVPAMADPNEDRKGINLIWAAVIFMTLIAPFMSFVDFIRSRYGGLRAVEFLGGTVVVFGLSFGMDIAYIAATRWMLRKVSDSRRFWRIVAILVLDAALAAFTLVLFIVPGGFIMMHSGTLTPMSFFGAGLALGFMFNMIDFLACAAFFVVLVAVLLHRLLWPIIERPVIAAFENGLLGRKRWLLIAAGILLSAPTWRSVFKLLLAKVLG